MAIKLIKRSKMIISLPIRILSEARDFYIKTMLDCAGRGYMYQDNAMGYAAYTPTPQGSKSGGFTGLTEEDIRQLVRMSIKMGQSEKESDGEWLNVGALKGVVGQGRSYSVVVGKIGRIDEEKPCDFVEVDDDKIKVHMFSRSRSYAVRNRKVSPIFQKIN